MNQKKKYKPGNPVRRLCVFAAVLCLLVMTGTAAFAETNNTDKKLKNGSFEEGQTWTGTYSQPDQSAVPSWNTTAFQGKIELFKENTGTYIPGVTLKPTAGTYAAELNADEESTLYQNVKTTPSSVYEWGLDHGARNGKDIMALVIGPKQSVDPSKPNKTGRDQLMQMVDWLNIDNSTITAGAEPKQYTVYSKKFAANGTFEDNAGNNAFSLTPSTIYTEEWHIWIMASSRATSGTNPWNSYGSNAEGSAGGSTGSSGTGVDLSKYYLYTVPAGQTETLFAFVSVGYVDSPVSADKAKTYGNFLDNINFQIYHPLSGSTTTHGSAVVGGSDGTTAGAGGTSGHTVTVDGKLTTYITHGESLKVQAIIEKDDADDGCEFVGLYHTEQDENGNPVTNFLKLAGNEIEDTGSLTEAEKAGKWVKSTNTDGDTIYTYYLDKVESATDLHFVFIKSPTITYDPNGGKPYVVERTYNTDEAANVYSFKPASGHNEAQAETGTSFIAPYVSHAAEGQNDGWKFMGWKLTGDTVDAVLGDNQPVAGTMGTILPAEHTIACEYHFDGVTLADSSKDTKAQYFKIYSGNVSLTKVIDRSSGEDKGVAWTDNGEAKAYANVHRGLTMVAQWRWRQAFIPQVGSGTTYADSAVGGTVEITSVTDTSDTNYNAAYNTNGGKSYHAETDETITATATANTGYIFEGWYDASGNQITTNATYSYTETKESVNTYYARFSPQVTQTYIRQVWRNNTWEEFRDDLIGTLGRYTYTDAVGMPISSTATAGTGYKFVGWYDSTGNKVADSMLTNNGATISYTTTGNATYYARFEKTYTVNFAAQTKQENGSFVTDTVGGTVTVDTVTGVNGAAASSKATANTGYQFLGWYDEGGSRLSSDAIYSTTTSSPTDGKTYFARFEVITYTVNFVSQTKQANGNFVENTTGGMVSESSVTGIVNTSANSTATANTGYKFLGWYNAGGNLLSMEATFSTTTSSATNGVTYYARFEKTYTVRFAAQTKQENGSFTINTAGGNVSVAFVTDVNGADASSEAAANTGYQFLGWYDVNGNLLSSNTLYTATITSAANSVTYYARFEAIPPATPTPTATAAPTPAPTTTPTTAPTSAPTAAPAPMPAPTPAQTTETHSIPRTGDEFPLIPVIAAGLISAVGIVLMLRIRKQR